MLRAARSPLVPLLALVALLVTAFALAACGGGGDGDDSSTEAETTASVPAGGCGEIEEVDVPMAGAHSDRDFTADDYSTNPPAGGDHNPNPLQAATFYDDASEPAPLGQAVHLLEHGAIIGWTNGLSKPDLKAVEDEFNDIYGDGYYQLATVENPDLDVPFALSAWGARAEVRHRRHLGHPAVRRAVVRVAEERRELGRLPGRRARARQLLRAEG